MPRKGKGGKVEGVDQTAYSNRSDLNNRGPQPITAAPGEPYGQRKMLEDAQRAVPMGGTATPTAPAAPAAPVAPVAPQVTPGSLLWDHPAPPLAQGQPLQTPGPFNPNMQHEQLSDLLDAAAAHPTASPQVQALADLARSAGW